MVSTPERTTAGKSPGSKKGSFVFSRPSPLSHPSRLVEGDEAAHSNLEAAADEAALSRLESAKKGYYDMSRAAPLLYPSRMSDGAEPDPDSGRHTGLRSMSFESAISGRSERWWPQQHCLHVEPGPEAQPSDEQQAVTRQDGIELRMASTPAEDSTIANHFKRMWLENGASAADVSQGWDAKTQRQLDLGRTELKLRAWIARIDGRPVGSVVAQHFPPDAFFGPPQLGKIGYIWGCFVLPDSRQLGVGRVLTNEAIGYLRTIGCMRVMLHSAPTGKPVYKPLVGTWQNLRLDQNL